MEVFLEEITLHKIINIWNFPIGQVLLSEISSVGHNSDPVQKNNLIRYDKNNKNWHAAQSVHHQNWQLHV